MGSGLNWVRPWSGKGEAPGDGPSSQTGRECGGEKCHSQNQDRERPGASRKLVLERKRAYPDGKFYRQKNDGAEGLRFSFTLSRSSAEDPLNRGRALSPKQGASAGHSQCTPGLAKGKHVFGKAKAHSALNAFPNSRLSGSTLAGPCLSLE